VLGVWPTVRISVRENRAFLGRAVRYLAAEAGIDQFVDIGSGLPNVGNVHEVAQALSPPARIVYVENDPVVLAHARALLTSNAEGATEYIDGDLRDTGPVLTRATQLLDFSRPEAVTLLSILRAVPDAGDPYAIVATLMDALRAEDAGAQRSAWHGRLRAPRVPRPEGSPPRKAPGRGTGRSPGRRCRRSPGPAR
jgi:hypothetical protein